jgi:glycerophosphoryl diester phosphodiesterase
LLVELKAEHCEFPVAEILRRAVREQGWAADQFIICAFDHTQLARMREKYPEFRTSALMAGIPVSLAKIAEEVGAWALGPCIHHMNQALVDDAHARGLKVLAWTINTEDEIAKAKALGVDGIISNYPDRI